MGVWVWVCVCVWVCGLLQRMGRVVTPACVCLCFSLRSIIQEPDLAAHCRKVWELAGPSILLTSISNFTAFLITALTPLTVIRAFAYQMVRRSTFASFLSPFFFGGLVALHHPSSLQGTAVALNLFFLVTLFGPLMTWDVFRSRAGRADVVLCKVMPSVKESDQDSRSASRRRIVEDDVAHESSFILKHYGPTLMKPIVKVLVIVVFGVLLGLLAWRGFGHNELGIRPSDIALEDTYQHDYISLQETEFPAYSSNIVSRSDDMPNAQVRRMIRKRLSECV